MEDSTERPNRMEATRNLLERSGCCLPEGADYSYDAKLALLEESLRCYIINCLAALRVIQNLRNEIQKSTDDMKYDVLKKKVFAGACLLMIETESNSDEVVVNTLLSSFPDDNKISDERTWLPMHFAMVLFLQNKISALDIHLMHTKDVLGMHRLSEFVHIDEDFGRIGCTPAHLLCMQKEPNVSVVKHICALDRDAFLLCDQSERNTLHLASHYSESVELLQILLQIDETMPMKDFCSSDYYDDCDSTKPLGLLCRRREFPTFHEMVACLIAANSTAEVMLDGILGCLESYRDSESKDHQIYPGSRGERTVILLEILLNLNVVEHFDTIFRSACTYLKGELGIAVLSLLLTKDITLVKNVGENDDMPIHIAAHKSSLNVMKFLHEAYPESLSILGCHDDSLLHLALQTEDVIDRGDKVEYLCKHCPSLIHQKNVHGITPFHHIFTFNSGHLFDMKSITRICDVDDSVVKCAVNDVSLNNANRPEQGQLPLHLLIANNPPQTELSDEGDCFRLFLRIYPASAGIRDSNFLNPYRMADPYGSKKQLSVYFRRLLLAADPTIHPMKRRDLNYEARKDGLFLAFAALSVDREPTIWSKLRHKGNDLLARVLAYL
jgi:hypothetical protein